VHTFFGEILENYNFWLILVKIVPPPNDTFQNNMAVSNYISFSKNVADILKISQ